MGNSFSLYSRRAPHASRCVGANRDQQAKHLFHLLFETKPLLLQT
jgi:hypothetical protein